MKIKCDSCQLVRIQGKACHEIGCPDSWKNQTRECHCCEFDFIPEDRFQSYCDDCLNHIELGDME